MSVEDNKAKYRRFYEEFLSKGRLAVVDEVVAPDVVSHSPLPDQEPGAEGLKQAIGSMRKIFPDLTAHVQHIVAEGDLVSGHFKVTATHQGEFMGVPATGKRIEYEEMVVVRFENGKIAEHWSVVDALSLMQQLGALPESA